MKGKQLSAPCIERLLHIVTNEQYSPTVTKDTFYNMYTLRKHQKKVEEGQIKSSGFSSRTLLISDRDFPGYASTNSHSGSLGEARSNRTKAAVHESVSTGSDSLSNDSDEELSDCSEDDCFDDRSEDEEKPIKKEAEAVLWMRDPISQLQKMIDMAEVGTDLILEVKEQHTTDHDGQKQRVFDGPMSSDLAVHAFSKVKDFILNHQTPDHDIAWFDGSEKSDFIHSFVAGLLLYSDKTNPTRWKQFYPVHLSCINFSPAFQQRMIDDGHTIVGLLPTNILTKGGMKVTKQLKQLVLHKALGVIFDPMASKVLSGIMCKNGTLNCHGVLANYVTDFPEGKDASGTRNSIKTALPCTGCTVTCGNLACSTDSPVKWRKHADVSKKRAQAVELILQANSKPRNQGAGKLRAAGLKILKDASLSTVRPFYENWPFIDGKLHKLLDAHRIFGFERLHDLPIGFQRILLDSSINYLGKVTNSSSAMLNAKGEARPISSIKTTIIECVNTFLTETHHFSSMPGIRLDYSANGGFLNTDGVIGMLEASDMLSVLTVFPFIGMILDSYIGLPGKGHFTELFCLYTEISQTIYDRFVEKDSYFPHYRMTERKIKHLRDQIRKLKALTLGLLGSVEKHGLEAHKVHLLDHVYDDLKRLGCFFIMAADTWEAAHKQLKEAFRATSKKNDTFIEETIAILHSRACAEEDFQTLRESIDQSVPDDMVSALSGNIVGKKSLEAIHADSAALSNSGQVMILGSLAAAGKGRFPGFSKNVSAQGSGLQLRPTIPNTKISLKALKGKSAERCLAEEIGLNGIESLSNLIEEKMGEFKGLDADAPEIQIGQVTNENNIPHHIANVQLRRVSSGRVASVGTPDLSSLRHALKKKQNLMEASDDRRDYSDSNNFYAASLDLDITDEIVMTIRKKNRRQLDPIVASGSFYGRQRYDSLLVELDEYYANTVGPPGIVTQYSDGSRNATIVHAAKALAFFRIPALKAISEEWVLLKYYEVANQLRPEIDSRLHARFSDSGLDDEEIVSFDELLKCVRLRWAKKDGEPFIDLLPISCLRGKVQIVRCSNAVSLLTSRKEKKDHWEQDFFYINRYCSSGQTKKYDVNSGNEE